jgi:two-component system phosphate regulon sensor histidine kinase PhoR
MQARLQDALLTLVKLEQREFADVLRAITEVSAEALGVDRVSIWWLRDTDLICEDLFVRSQEHHEHGAHLLVADYPHYLQAVRRGRALAATDARHDPDTAELAKHYLIPLGIESMLDVPIWRGPNLLGVVCHESLEPHAWNPSEIAFAANLADLVTRSLEARDRKRIEGWMAVILDCVPEALVILDENRVEAVNRATRQLLAEVTGSSTLDTEAWREEVEYRDAQGSVIPHAEGPVARAFRGEVIKDEIVGLHFKRNGITRYYRASLTPTYEGGRVTHVVVLGIDTSEEVRFEQIKRDFLVTLAHELKTPLAVIQGYAEYLGGLAPLADHAAHLGAIVRRTRQMDRIVNNLLDLASIELGRLVFIPQRVELGALVAMVVREARHTHRDRPIEVDTGASVWVHGDRPRIEQVVRELVTNAMRYSASGTPIKITIHHGHQEVVLAVTDHGIGIPKPLIGKLFAPFFRAHAGTEDDHGGLGIGLFLVREIARRHGGDAWIESEENRGTTAFVRLPTTS